MRFPTSQALLLAGSTCFAEAFVPPLASSAIRQNLFVHQHATTTTSTTFINSRSLYTRLYQKSKDEEEDDEDDVVLDEDDDWRTFRAKLVMGETSTPPSPAKSSENEGDLDGIGSLFVETEVKPVTTEDMTPLDPSQWAYDSGNVIEQGAVILGGVEQDFGFGLRQQYFHKAAILVLDHDEATFTKGIILNRPTDLMLEDDINPGKRWRVWFGGDVQGMNSQHPDIVCLHSLKSQKASNASVPVMKDIKWTTFDNAKRLVKAGVAQVSDFWVFVGYAGWGPRQLMGELDRNSWNMVATDSQTLLKELARQSKTSDPRDAGLDTWTLLMNMIGRKDTARKFSGDFDDLMLKEWAFNHLLSSAAGGNAGAQERSPSAFDTYPEFVDQLMSRVLVPDQISSPLMGGALVRMTPKERSPYLLENQELHKAVVLIISDDEMLSLGAILNRPAAKGLDIQIRDKNTGGARTVTIPLRFGGHYSLQGEDPLIWLHCNPALRQSSIGDPVGRLQQNGIWKCTKEEVIWAIGQGVASPEDFVAISGVFVWSKEGGVAQGIAGEFELGKFEQVSSSKIDNVWSALLRQQDVLTSSTLDSTLELSNEAWNAGNGKSSRNDSVLEPTPIAGLGEGFDEEDDSLVFKSDVKVAKLSDDALRSWVATFLLGTPKR